VVGIVIWRVRGGGEGEIETEADLARGKRGIDSGGVVAGAIELRLVGR
jgi:hypothetical protein